MPAIAIWLPILTGLVAAFIAYRVGYTQGKIAQRELDLNIRRATPRLGSRVELLPFNPVGFPHVTRYAIETTIYNDGDLVATKLEGKWNLVVSHGLPNAEKVIRADSLPSFMPYCIEHEIGGNTNWIHQREDVTIAVNIDLVYFGLDDEQKPYHARYNYDREQRRMIQAKNADQSDS